MIETTSVHPECQKMHDHGYCICMTVDDIKCDKRHPAHKPCPVKIVIDKDKKP